MRNSRVLEVEGFDLIRGTKKVKLILWEEIVPTKINSWRWWVHKILKLRPLILTLF